MSYTLVRISRFVRAGIENSLLTVAFILGIGITGVLFRIFGIRLLDHGDRSTAWNPPGGSKDDSLMY